MSLGTRQNNDGFTNAAIASFFILMLLGNCIWLLLRQERLANGGKWFSWDELRDFKQLVARQTDPSKRRAYMIMRYLLLACIALMFVVPLLLLGIGQIWSHLRN
jgi:hypothetical protein